MLSAGSDGYAKVWDLRTMKLMKTIWSPPRAYDEDEDTEKDPWEEEDDEYGDPSRRCEGQGTGRYCEGEMIGWGFGLKDATASNTGRWAAVYGENTGIGFWDTRTWTPFATIPPLQKKTPFDGIAVMSMGGVREFSEGFNPRRHPRLVEVGKEDEAKKKAQEEKAKAAKKKKKGFGWF